MRIFERYNGTIVATAPFIMTCGCGSIVPDTKKLLRRAGIDVAFVNSSINADARKYVKQIGLNKLVPSLNKTKHAVVFNPQTRQFVDLLNAPRNDQLVDNIRRVVS